MVAGGSSTVIINFHDDICTVVNGSGVGSVEQTKGSFTYVCQSVLGPRQQPSTTEGATHASQSTSRLDMSLQNLEGLRQIVWARNQTSDLQEGATGRRPTTMKHMFPMSLLFFGDGYSRAVQTWRMTDSDVDAR